MQNQMNKSQWHKPTVDLPLDELDREIFALGRVHGDAKRSSVGLSNFIYRLLREEYLEAQRINRSLTLVQRKEAIQLLEMRNPDESILDLLRIVRAKK